MFVIDSLNVLQLRTSLNVADVVEYTWCFMSKIALKNYINSKVTVQKISKFPDKGWNVNGLNYLLRDTGTTAR